MKDLAYLNGAILPKQEASIPVMDRGFLLGDGVFDTMLAKNGSILDGLDHMQRLLRGAGILDIGLDLTAEGLLQEAERFAAHLEIDLAAIRVTLTRGETPRGLAIPVKTAPNCVMTAAPGAVPNSKGAYSLIRAMPHELYKVNEKSPLSQIKVLNYLEPILGLRDAKQAGYDEILLKNMAGYYACGSVSNLFILSGNKIVTPALSQGCLDGITRKTILSLADKIGLQVEEGEVSHEMLVDADHIFQCNSLMGLRGFSELLGTDYKDPFSFPHFTNLFQAWLAHLEDRL